MNNKKFLRRLEEQRQSLANYEDQLPAQIRQNSVVLENDLLDRVAGRIMFYLFEDGKLKLIRAIKNFHLIGANVVLYLELQKRESTFQVGKFVEGYDYQKTYRKVYLMRA